jgi:branched-chain amino acid transport system substrate-binding protein
MPERSEYTRKQVLSGAAAAGLVGVGVGGVAGGLIGRETAPEDGSSASGPAKASGEPLVLGVALPLSGDLAADGEQVKNGVTVAVDEINGQGGVAGRPVKLEMVDTDPYAPESVTNGFERLVEARVDAICCGYMGAFQPSYTAVAPYGCPYLHGNSLEESVKMVEDNPDQYGSIFQISPSETWYGYGMIPFLDALAEQGTWKPSSRTISIIEGPFPYSTTISRTTQETARKSGRWEIAGVHRISTPISDWRPVISRIQSDNPGVVMNTHPVATELASFARQFAENPTDSLAYLQYGPSVPEFLRLAKDAANGIVWATVIGVYDDQFGDAYRELYTEAFDAEPGYGYAGIMYDMVHILARAWQGVDDPSDFDAVTERLGQLVHRGVCGGYYMGGAAQAGRSYPTQTEDPSIGSAHLFFQIQDGEHQLISPQPYATGKFAPASWQT